MNIPVKVQNSTLRKSRYPAKIIRYAGDGRYEIAVDPSARRADLTGVYGKAASQAISFKYPKNPEKAVGQTGYVIYHDDGTGWYGHKFIWNAKKVLPKSVDVNQVSVNMYKQRFDELAEAQKERVLSRLGYDDNDPEFDQLMKME